MGLLEKFYSRIGWGPLLQAFSPFGAGRLLSFFYGVGDYDSLIVYPAQMSEYLKQTSDIDVKPDDLQIIPNTPEYDETTYEKETVSLVKNKVNGDVYGLFTYDDKTNKVVDVQTIKDNRPPAPSITSGTMTKEQAKAAILAQGYTEPITFIPDSDGQTSYEFVDADGLDGTATLNNGNIIVQNKTQLLLLPLTQNKTNHKQQLQNKTHNQTYQLTKHKLPTEVRIYPHI